MGGVFGLIWPVSSAPIQLLFSFDQDIGVAKTFTQILASQLSSLSCNSCSPLTRTWELRKLRNKLSLFNSYHLSYNSCSRLTTGELRKFSYKLSLTNSSIFMQLLFSFDQDMRVDKTLIQILACQLSCNSCSCMSRTRELRKLSYKLSLLSCHQLSSRYVPSWWALD